LPEPFLEFVHGANYQLFWQMLSGLAIAPRRQPDLLLADALARAQQRIEPALHQLSHAAGQRAARLQPLHHHHPHDQTRGINADTHLQANLPLQQAEQLGRGYLPVQAEQCRGIDVGHYQNITPTKCFG
jgi:hypothetical protein